MGYVVVARTLGQTLLNKLRSAANIEFINPAEVIGLKADDQAVSLTVDTDGTKLEITSRLVVGADGANSRVRAMAGLQADIKDYNQMAIVSNISTAISHANTAFERFTPQGPLALLPLGHSTLFQSSVSVKTIISNTWT